MLRNALDGGRLNEQKPARCLHYMNVIVPGGGITIELDEDQAAEYNADLDACAARFVGLAKFEYLLWVDLNGAPLCGARTTGGELCRNAGAGGTQFSASEWKARRRKAFCATHAQMMMRSHER
jgi:hypothetical protein